MKLKRTAFTNAPRMIVTLTCMNHDIQLIRYYAYPEPYSGSIEKGRHSYLGNSGEL